MRIVLVSPSYYGYDRAIAMALERLGHEVTSLAYPASATLPQKVRNRIEFEVLPRMGANAPALARRRRFNERLLAAATGSLRSDLVLVVKGDMIEPEVLEKLSRRCTCAYWGYDDPFRYPSVVESLGVYAVVASFSMCDTQHLAVEGHPSTYLPLGFDSGTFGVSSERLPAKGTPEVSFVGARYPEREAALAGLQDHCTLGIWGGDWRPKPWRARFYQRRTRLLSSCEGAADLEVADRIYRSCKVNVNIHGDWDGLNMRVFEIPGAGGFQLCDSQAGVEEMFEPDREIVLYGSRAELEEKALYYLKHDSARDRIAVAGHVRAQAEHTLVHRMRKFLGLIRATA